MTALALVACCALVCCTFLATLRTADRWLAHVLRPAEPAAVEALRAEVMALKSEVASLRSRDALGRL